MDKAFSHHQTIKERTAAASIRRIATHMDRSERLAIVLMLIKDCFEEADRLTGLAEVTLEVKGSPDFNEKARTVKSLFQQLPTRSLAELAVAILLPEVSYTPDA